MIDLDIGRNFKDITIHEDYIDSKWLKRYNEQPEEIKKKLDKLANEINLLDYKLFF